jgi:hypothetical protein
VFIYYWKRNNIHSIPTTYQKRRATSVLKPLLFNNDDWCCCHHRSIAYAMHMMLMVAIGSSICLVLEYRYSLICADARGGVMAVVAAVLDIEDGRRFFDFIHDRQLWT